MQQSSKQHALLSCPLCASLACGTGQFLCWCLFDVDHRHPHFVSKFSPNRTLFLFQQHEADGRHFPGKVMSQIEEDISQTVMWRLSKRMLMA